MNSGVVVINPLSVSDVKANSAIEYNLNSLPPRIANQLEVMLKQRDKENRFNTPDPITTNNISGTYTVYELTHEDKLSILKKAQAYVRENSVDLDPEIRDLVNENFANLLWK